MKLSIIVIFLLVVSGCSTSQQISREANSVNKDALKLLEDKRKLDDSMGMSSQEQTPTLGSTNYPKGTASKQFDKYVGAK